MRSMVVVLVVAAACGGSDGPSKIVDAQGTSDVAIDSTQFLDAPPYLDAKQYFDAPPDASGPCNPLTQQGCNAGDKCTWLLDAVMPTYVGHIGCAPSGTAPAGDPCMYGAPGVTGFDNCQKGLVCGNYRGGAGVCKTICDQQGGFPACAANQVCVVYSGLFSTGVTTPAAGGVCDLSCDPIADNDFDGAGPLAKTGTVCTAADTGCYGYPSFGTPPTTGWSCTTDIHAQIAQPTGLRHRVQCTTATGCADAGPVIYVNSCNQGYLPLLRETTFSSIAVCVALCKPKNCYAGNCGTNDEDRLGMSPHRCTTVDRVGTFDNTANGEHCRYLWSFEQDDQSNFLRSATSDTVGFCFDHSKYLYDSNNDNQPDAPLPACAALQNGFGTGTNPMDPLTFYGAADFGCVDTTHAGLPFAGKVKLPANHKPTADLRPLYNPTRAP